MLVIETNRSGYTTGQCGRTMTVGELYEVLTELMDYGNEDEPIYLSNDKGYTFGRILSDDIFDVMNEEEYHDVKGCI